MEPVIGLRPGPLLATVKVRAIRSIDYQLLQTKTRTSWWTVAEVFRQAVQVRKDGDTPPVPPMPGTKHEISPFVLPFSLLTERYNVESHCSVGACSFRYFCLVKPAAHANFFCN